MDCEEDASALLSLSHSLLPPDSTSTAPSSSGQLNTWSGQDSSNEISGSFSPVSPPSGYTSLNHGMSESSNHPKYFSNRLSNHNLARTNIIMGYSRPDRSVLPMAFPGTEQSASHSTTPATSSDFILNAAVHGGEEQMNLYYEQVTALRNTPNVYDSHHSLAQDNSGGSDFDHEVEHTNVTQTNSSLSSHSGYSNEHCAMELTANRSQDSESLVEAMNRSSHTSIHPTSGVIIPASTTLYDARGKNSDYSKEMSTIYEVSSSKSNFGPNHQLCMTSERRSAEMHNLVNELEFSVNSREFAAVTASTSNSNSNQFDYNSLNRSNEELDYRFETMQDRSAYNMNQDQASLKYSLSSSLATENINAPSRRSAVWELSEFQMNPQQQQQPSEEINFNHGQKKLLLSGQGNNGSKGQALGMQPQRLRSNVKPVNSSGKVDSSMDENQHREVQSSLSSKNGANWGGRTRAHRKMARLLGQTDYNERSSKTQAHDACTTTPRPMLFQKMQSSTMQTTFREAHKPIDHAVKYHFPQESQRDTGSNDQVPQGNERETHSVSYPSEHEQGIKRDDEISKHQGGMRDFNLPAALGLSAEGHSLSVQRDPSSMLSNPHLLSSQLDLDFPQTLSLDSSHDPVSQDELFNHSIEPQHIAQQNLAFTDHLNGHNSQDLSLESSYLNSTAEKDLDLIRKYPDQNQRELASDNDFDFDEYIGDSRLTQSYFERPSNLPQDMTTYQKSGSDKLVGNYNSSSKPKDREAVHGSKAHTKQNNLSELNRELTKSSAKESLKGIRIPRDINRALEILQDMQENERAEERRKEEFQKQLQNELHEQKEKQHQQHQMQHQHISINSSPKKTFQNKHHIESLTLTVQQFLAEQGNFIDDQPEAAVNLLEQPALGLIETQQQQNTLMCDSNLQDMSAYSAFPSSHQVTEMAPSLMNKREHQPNEGYQNVNSTADNHMLKKFTLSTSTKDQGLNPSLSSISIPPMSNSMSPSGHDLSFNLSNMSRFSEQIGLLNDSVSNRLSLPGTYSIDQELIRHKVPYQIKNGDPKTQSFQTFRHEPDETESQDKLTSAKREANILANARQNLYAMMKKEQLCDAVLSISQQKVKVHQVVLCSMSLYLCNLLQKVRSSSQPLTSHVLPMPASHSVALVINSDAIKSSSVSAFLLFIYLGKIDFTDSNIVDLFILASSLHVSLLKELCQEYMWKVNISVDQVKIPQVHVVNSLPSYQNQACQVSLSSEVATEDKSVNTGSIVKSLPAATQTDKSTSSVGGGGQEEWVMLKKTKQKTVSPSKMKYGSTAKCSLSADNSLIYKPGKKGWLSPKRRFKTEQHLAQAKVENIEQDKFINASTALTVNSVQKHKINAQSFLSNHVPTSTKDQGLFSSLSSLSIPLLSTSNSMASSEHHTGDNLHTHVTSSLISYHETGTTPKTINSAEVDHHHHLNQRLPKTQRTTVEIAEEAAAAKSAAHNYGTRFSGRGSNKPCISYSALVHAYDKKRASSSSREKPSLIKKKDFVKKHSADILNSKLLAHDPTPLSESSSYTDDNQVAQNAFNSESFCSGVEEALPVKGGSSTAYFDSDPQRSRAWKLPVGKPLKKNIAQRAQDNDVSLDSSSQDHLPFTENCSLTSTDSREDDVEIPVVSTSSSMSSSNISIADGDLTNVSSIIDSLVNTLESDGGETDLQIVLSDLDSELGNSLLPPTTPVSSSIPVPVSVSKSSLYNVKEMSPPPPPSVSSSLSLSSSPLSLSSPIISSSESVVNNTKTKSTPQDYRKRLIQLIKSEKADNSISDAGEADIASALVEGKQFDRGINVSDQNVQSLNNLSSPPSSLTFFKLNEVKDGNGSSVSQAADEEKMTGKSSLIDKSCDGDLTSKFEEATRFHKIFKRKRKAKFRKSSSNEIEASNIKYRPKKGQGPDLDGGNFVKVRPRRNTANDSDSGSSRPKIRKAVPNDSDNNVLKVRPPPKKRAKMELELLKVANKKLESDIGEGAKKGEEVSKNTNIGNIDMDKSTNSIICEQKEADRQGTEVMQESEILDAKKMQLKERKAKKTCGEKLKKITDEIKKENRKSDKKDSVVCESKPVVKKESSPKVPKEINPYVQILEEKLKSLDVNVKLFSCNFCQAQFKRAQRTVKHITQYHEITGQEILDNVTIGQDGKAQEACDICGYITKDATYKYMHYHKYFKHNVPLPKGWNLCKCQICNKEFHTNFQLKEHIQTHSDKFFFVCQFCGQIFKTRNSFNSHIFHRHSKERKHLCKICLKTFKTWTQLKIHVRSHTGERPFSCTECSYGSTTQGNMRYHLANKHEMEKSKVEECMKKITSKTPEMNPAALEELMASIMAKTIPDKALKEPNKKSSQKRKEKGDSKGKNKPSSSKATKKENCAKTMTTSSKVTAQVKAFLSDKGSVSASPATSSSTPLPSSSSTQSHTDIKSSVCLSMDCPSTSSAPKDTQPSPAKQPVKKVLKDLCPAISQALSSDESVIFPSASSSSSLSSLLLSQDQAFLQAGSTLPSNLTGYALVPSHLLPGTPDSFGPVRDGSSDQTGSILFVSESALLPAGTVLSPQDNAGFQIADVNSAQVPQVNLFLNEPANAVPTHQPPILQFPAGAGIRSFSNGGNTLVLNNSSKDVSEEGCYVPQGPGGPCMLYVNSSVFGQQPLVLDGSQQGIQPLFISYPGLPGQQVVQGLTELQFVPQAQEGGSTASGELIPVILSEQVTESSSMVENVEEEVGSQQNEVVLTMEVSDAAKKEVKAEGTIETDTETSAKSQSSSLSSSEKSEEAVISQETNMIDNVKEQ